MKFILFFLLVSNSFIYSMNKSLSLNDYWLLFYGSRVSGWKSPSCLNSPTLKSVRFGFFPTKRIEAENYSSKIKGQRVKDGFCKIKTIDLKGYKGYNYCEPNESFFSGNIKKVMFLVHNSSHDLKKECLKNKTISAIPLIFFYDQKEVILPYFSIIGLRDTGSTRFYTKKIEASFFDPKGIENVFAKYFRGPSEQSYFWVEGDSKDIKINVGEKDKFSLEAKFFIQYHTSRHSSSEYFYKISIKNDERVSLFIANSYNEACIMDVTAPLFHQNNSHSIVSEMQREWLREVSAGGLERLERFRNYLLDAKKPASPAIENHLSEVSFGAFKKQVIKLCDKKIIKLLQKKRDCSWSNYYEKYSFFKDVLKNK